MDNIQQLKQRIDGSDRIVFFGGAGVSTMRLRRRCCPAVRKTTT